MFVQFLPSLIHLHSFARGKTISNASISRRVFQKPLGALGRVRVPPGPQQGQSSPSGQWKGQGGGWSGWSGQVRIGQNFEILVFEQIFFSKYSHSKLSAGAYAKINFPSTLFTLPIENHSSIGRNRHFLQMLTTLLLLPCNAQTKLIIFDLVSNPSLRFPIPS